MSKRTKKLALKRETLRKLDESQLGQVAGGWTLTQRCAGDRQQAGVSGGCNTSDLTKPDNQVVYQADYANFYFNGG
ncbi:MAG TPA: class I lanthipeptide [Kofleriaceae bacterium]|nr:class I lanthipeptide [Kofleriaceae bacterium]